MAEERVCVEDAIRNLQQSGEKMKLPTRAIKRLFDSFVQGGHHNAQVLRNAVEKRQIEQAKSSAHAIRGTALSLSFDEIAAACDKIEYEEGCDLESLSAMILEAFTCLDAHKEEIVSALE